LRSAAGVVVVVVAVDVAQQPEQLGEGRFVHAAAVLFQTVAGALPELIQCPPRLRDPDDRHGQMPAAHHRLQRRKDLLVREVAGGAEEDQGVGARRTHGRPPGSS
jgi:hypothetical protein